VRYCTPTAAESGRVATACEAVDGTAAVVRWLSHGVSPNAVDQNFPLLACASFKGRVDTVDLLLAVGADVDAGITDTGATSLYLAAQEGHVVVVEKLIAACADVEKARTTDGSTPLYMAAQEGHTATVEKLIAASADVDKAKTTTGSTPLWSAAQNGHTAVVSKLLQHGADKSIRGFYNVTPLEVAQRFNHAAVVALLA